MTVFNVHDRNGKLLQSNKLFNPKGYADILRERGYTFVEHDAPAPVDIQRFHVNAGTLTERPLMPVQASSLQIKAGGNERAAFRNVPKNAKITVTTGGIQLWSGVVGQSDFDLPIPVPCVYRILIELWPYRDFICEVVAS
jgi:hypothetical protein